MIFHLTSILCAIFVVTDLQFKAGNITGDETIALLEELNTAVFDSSGAASNAYDPYSCNLNGLSTYVNCPFGDDDTTLLQLHTKRVREHHYDHHHRSRMSYSEG